MTMNNKYITIRYKSREKEKKNTNKIEINCAIICKKYAIICANYVIIYTDYAIIVQTLHSIVQMWGLLLIRWSALVDLHSKLLVNIEWQETRLIGTCTMFSIFTAFYDNNDLKKTCNIDATCQIIFRFYF